MSGDRLGRYAHRDSTMILLAGEELARAQLLVVAPWRGVSHSRMIGALLRFAVKTLWLISGFGVVGRRVRIEALGG
jgi:hypothetical protein